MGPLVYLNILFVTSGVHKLSNRTNSVITWRIPNGVPFVLINGPLYQIDQETMCFDMEWGSSLPRSGSNHSEATLVMMVLV
jgi:hypothetical protein